MFERLEDRWVLSPTITPTPSQIVSAGDNYMIPLVGSDTSALTYNVTTNNGAFFSAAPSILSPSTPSSSLDELTINTTDGPMQFLLLDGDSTVAATVTRIENAVTAGAYNNDKATFYFSNGNIVEGGTGAAGSNSLEIDPQLQFTTSGVLAIVNAGGTHSDSNDFVITTQPITYADGSDTIFGIQAQGASVRNEIALATRNGTSLTPAIQITSVSVTPVDTSAVLLLPVDQNATGTATITVTATDASSGSAQESFTVATATPAAPGPVTFPGGSPTNQKNATFDVADVYDGAQVSVYAQAAGAPSPVLIGTATASGDTVQVPTTLPSDGTYTITATQSFLTQNVDSSLNPTYQASAPTSAADSMQITLDTTPPTVTTVTPSTATINEADVGSGKFSVVVAYSEAMNTSSTPAISFSPTVSSTLALASGSWTSDTQYTATYNVTNAGVTVASVGIDVTGAADLAGNTQTAYSGSSNFAIDTVSPSVSSVTPSTMTINEGDVGSGTFSVVVAYSEAMNTSSTPTITFSPAVSSTLTAAGGSWTNSTEYTATYNVSNAGVTVASVGISVTGATDAAGNAQTAYSGSNNFGIDTVAPAVSSVTPSTQTITEADIGSGTFSVTVAYSTAMSTSSKPTISFSPAVSSTLALASGGWSNDMDYIAIYNVLAANATVASVAIDVTGATDASGNAQTAYSGSDNFAIDTAPPTVTGVTPSTATINEADAGSGTFSITLTYSEAMDSSSTPAITFSPAVSSTLTLSSGSWTDDTDYTATYDVANAGVTVASVAVGVTGASDTAGNTQTAYSGSNNFAIDTVAPTVTSVTPSPLVVTVANAVQNKPLTLAVLFSEAMDTAVTPVISFPTAGEDPTAAPATLTAAGGSWSSDGKTYTATFNVVNQSVKMSSIDVEVAGAEDAAGNPMASASTTSSVFSIDMVDPAVLSLTPNLTTLAAANTGSGAFTLTVVYSEAMDTGLNPTITFPTSGKDPVTGGTLTFSSGSWSSDTTYVASYNVANQGLVMSSIDVEAEGAMDSSATYTQVPSTQSGVFSINMPATSTLAGLVSLGSGKLGIGGVTVRLLEGGTEVSGSPVQTGSDGSYSFTALPAGTYTIELVESPDYVTWSETVTGSSPSGTVAGTDEIQVTLGSGVNGTGYDFSAKDIQPALISARMFFASAPPLIQMVEAMHTAPTVSLSGSSGTASTATYEAGGSAAAIAPDATITSSGSTTLVGLTATITNPEDGSSEVLAASTSGTSITSAYADNVLTLSGVADVSVYQTLLESITYSDTASSPQTGDRTITVVANDGTASSQAAAATVAVQAASTAAAATDSAMAQTANWLQS
jgi:cyclophilin family peptidyl-prolyl cis-trans isomerase